MSVAIFFEFPQVETLLVADLYRNVCRQKFQVCNLPLLFYSQVFSGLDIVYFAGNEPNKPYGRFL